MLAGGQGQRCRIRANQVGGVGRLRIVQSLHGLRIARHVVELCGVAAGKDRQPPTVCIGIDLAEIVVRQRLRKAAAPVRVAIFVAIRHRQRRRAVELSLCRITSSLECKPLALLWGQRPS